MRIRHYIASDAPALAALYARSVRGVGPRDYSPEQVGAWVSLAPTAEQMHRRCVDGRSVVVAVDEEDGPIGFCDIERDGHIGYLYCSPDAVGTGVARALYEAVEEIARQAGLPRIHVEASEAAKRFFAGRGFVVVTRRDLMIGDVPIHNFAMEKRLER
jgi:putative acetyltransferase